jgi:Flp pilus assembly protein TadG
LGSRGAAAVEFAIVLPLLAVLLFGMVDFSIIMYDKALLTNASRDGARFGAIFSDSRPTCADIYAAAVQNYEQSLITFGGSTTITAVCNSREFDEATSAFGAPGTGVCVEQDDQLGVEVRFTYDFLLVPNFLNAFFDSSVPLQLPLASRTVMRCE